MRHSNGLTFVEVLVALLVLAVGVIAASMMQTTALRTTSRGNVSQELVKLAEAELEMQRQFTTPTAGNVCLSSSGTGYSCLITVVACQYQSASNNIVCDAGTTVTDPMAYQTTVTVTGPNSDTLSLSNLILLETT